MTVLLALFAIAALLSLFFCLRTIRRLRQRHLLRAGGACVSCLLFAFVAGMAFVVIFSYLGYERLVAEERVASIAFERLRSDEYRARLMVAGQADRFFDLQGDEWQIDARLVTWKPPATILGLDPIYRLDRISGRYAEIERERTAARTVHSLAAEQPVDVWRIARARPLLLPGVDAHYGSATFVPMVDGARFDISLSRDALIARPANEIAEMAIGNWE